MSGAGSANGLQLDREDHQTLQAAATTRVRAWFRSAREFSINFFGCAVSRCWLGFCQSCAIVQSLSLRSLLTWTNVHYQELFILLVLYIRDGIFRRSIIFYQMSDLNNFDILSLRIIFYLLICNFGIVFTTILFKKNLSKVRTQSNLELSFWTQLTV